MSGMHISTFIPIIHFYCCCLLERAVHSQGCLIQYARICCGDDSRIVRFVVAFGANVLNKQEMGVCRASYDTWSNGMNVIHHFCRCAKVSDDLSCVRKYFQTFLTNFKVGKSQIIDFNALLSMVASTVVLELTPTDNINLSYHRQ